MVKVFFIATVTPEGELGEVQATLDGDEAKAAFLAADAPGNVMLYDRPQPDRVRKQQPVPPKKKAAKKKASD